jgi:uncharacterized integral membrane protein
MRFIWFLILVIFVTAVVVFAYQNNDAVQLRFFDWGLTVSLALLIGAVYVLGMLSGWSVVGMMRRSIREVTARRSD